MMLVEALVALLLVMGGVFSFLGALGLVRFPDPLSRLHGPSKATTLGLGSVLAASVLYFTALDGAPSLRELTILLFVAITTPVAALWLGRVAREHHRVSNPHQPTEGNDEDLRNRQRRSDGPSPGHDDAHRREARRP